MELIREFYGRVISTGTFLLSLNILIFFLCLYTLLVKKNRFVRGFIVATIFFSLLFAAVAIPFYQEALNHVHTQKEDISVYDQSLHRAKQHLNKCRTRVAIEMVIVLIALLMLLRATPDSEKQGISIALIICASLLFAFDLYVSTQLGNHIAQLEVARHNQLTR